MLFIKNLFQSIIQINDTLLNMFDYLLDVFQTYAQIQYKEVVDDLTNFRSAIYIWSLLFLTAEIYLKFYVKK